MKFSALALALAASIAPVLGFPAPAAEGLTIRTVPAPRNFSITSFGMLGTGCPPGSAFHVLSDDRESVTVGFSQFWAEVGPGIPISKNRKSCLLTFGVAIPGGYTLGVGSVETRGWYQLDSAVTASQQSKYYFQGLLQSATARQDMVGLVPGANYVYNDNFDLASLALSPCGGYAVLNIQAELRTSNSANPQGHGYIATDSIVPDLEQTFNFNFFPCRS
ncbi:hypothetical protein BKA70DRAFT_1570141 [Coprinopsis sp. MPI-PUGE-AT-0042]|nr:hypothetical protein BKA70DRAFT_1570141 [Coprinopsis sp. MPI-PUGE-AT-0042]